MAEVDDMAMMRLLAREAEALALVPPVVVRDEIEDGVLVQTHRIPQIRETFFAITPSRRFPNSLVGELVSRMTPKKYERRFRVECICGLSRVYPKKRQVYFFRNRGVSLCTIMRG